MLSVALGRYKLYDFNEQESVFMNVARHIFHPEYMHTGTSDSDLAILILSSLVEFIISFHQTYLFMELIVLIALLLYREFESLKFFLRFFICHM